MALPLDDLRALVVRLAPKGDRAADAVSRAVEEGEELREVLVDVDGEVVAFTDRRALFVAVESGAAQGFGYDSIDVRRRGDGLSVDAVVEAGRLVLEVARSTFTRLGVIAQGAAPSWATWLPAPAARLRPLPEAAPVIPPVTAPPPPQPDPSFGPRPVPPAFESTAPAHRPPAPTAPPAYRPVPPPAAGAPAPGWHPDPARVHWWRWWDGQDWTAFVADGGPAFTDPLPPRR